MACQVQKIFESLKCEVHTEASIMQVCVSSSCPERNRLCCLECVDEKHMGHEHVLISYKKLGRLVEEFHAVLNEKQSLNTKLFKKLKDQQQYLNTLLDWYFKLIENRLARDNQLMAFEELGQMDLKSTEGKELKTKINEFIGDHSWMLEMNAKSKVSEGQNGVQKATLAIRQKYALLEKRLRKINSKCETQIKEAVERRAEELRKLLHLFEEVKYKVEDDGQEFQRLASSINKL